MKDKIPNRVVLDARLTTVLANGFADFLENTKNRRAETKANLRFTFVSFAFFITVCIFLILFSIKIGTGILFQMTVTLSIVWLLILLFSGRAWLRNTKLLAREVNMALTPVFSELFDRLFLYTYNGDHEQRVKDLLTESSLLTVNNLIVRTDDSFEVFVDNDKIEFHEILVDMREEMIVSNTQKRIETELFRGMLIVAPLSTIHQGETYISTDGDRYGFAHQSFWTTVLHMSNVKTTELEWNDFEKVLHVASTDEQVAREFLTPEIMLDIHDWWQEHQLNMRIAIKHDRFYLLLPESKVRITSATTSTKLSEIVKYAKTMAIPIWRGLMLVDDVVGR